MFATEQTAGTRTCILTIMSSALTTDQFRILRNARDGITAAACVFRPKSYFLDVEMLVREHLVTSRDGRLDLTPRGTAHLLPCAAG
jgi:hypothetical protein